MAIQKVFPKSLYHPRSKVLTYLTHRLELKGKGMILVITAGTTDIPVGEEAAITAQFMGNRVETLYDVGVAGIHRLLSERPRLEAARVLIVVAGMEGALPSVVGRLVDRPVIAVPTSIGYGTSFGGVAALLAMLNSCASGVSVVNIDNGFGAGCMASLINHM
jgi:NCAIR mutase (PurE)-related protein